MEHSIYKNMIVLVVLLSVAAVMFEPVQTVPINDERAIDLLRRKNSMIARQRDLVNRQLRDSRDALRANDDFEAPCLWGDVHCLKMRSRSKGNGDHQSRT
ncbi:Hypothetical predicted protein [Octopus vulgaris]|uniref:Uncharacterized protein n=1 Tax=Octopus vulgaris TaxID=6645 RepID=A0AA36BC84_OCTVU|nr:Hypothetical predicted protein [Octopus vulgaris]